MEKRARAFAARGRLSADKIAAALFIRGVIAQQKPAPVAGVRSQNRLGSEGEREIYVHRSRRGPSNAPRTAISLMANV